MTELSSTDWHWTPDLSVGVSAIDEDHKQLFQLFYEANLIKEGSNDTALLYELAQKLVLYSESHFKREEALMKATSDSSFDSHHEKHRTMTKNLHQTLKNINRNNESITDFITFLSEEFISHIKGEDQHISRFTKGHEEEIEQALTLAGPLTLPDSVSIYVVDDEQQQVDLMLEMIDLAGLTASGFTSALEFIQHNISDHDIILLDLNMPDIDGIEVMRTLHAKGCVPSYILISGFDERVLHSTKQFADAKHISVVETLMKPINTRNFMELINELYAKKKILIDQRVASQHHQQKSSDRQATDSLSIDDLHNALQHHHFVLFYQPQIDIQSGELHGLEALIRLQHPEYGLIFPDQFISLAEQYSIISAITDEVIDLATEGYKSFCAAGIHTKISINISAQDLLDLSMPERLEEKLKQNNIPANSIMIELTESAVLSSVSDSLDILNRLRMKNFALSIDDFGTGNSSLVQLYQAPFTELKIDQHFIMKMMKDDEAMSIVKICILLAKELKMETVAEGVETQEILHTLKELGCDIAQGYVLSKPIPLEDCCEWINQHR